MLLSTVLIFVLSSIPFLKLCHHLRFDSGERRRQAPGRLRPAIQLHHHQNHHFHHHQNQNISTKTTISTTTKAISKTYLKSTTTNSTETFWAPLTATPINTITKFLKENQQEKIMFRCADSGQKWKSIFAGFSHNCTSTHISTLILLDWTRPSSTLTTFSFPKSRYKVHFENQKSAKKTFGKFLKIWIRICGGSFV